MDSSFNPRWSRDRRRKLRRRETLAERVLWQHLRARRLEGCRFHRQYGVGPFILDFYAPSVRLGIEVDGPYHRRPDVVAYDRRRTEYINHFRITILRFTNEEVFCHCGQVVAEITSIIRELSSDP